MLAAQPVLVLQPVLKLLHTAAVTAQLLGADLQRPHSPTQLLLLPLLLFHIRSILWLAERSSNTTSSCRCCSHNLHWHSKWLCHVSIQVPR
jgi:hypothetical protein